MPRILVVDDDKDLSDGICLALKSNETTFIQCFDCKSAREAVENNSFDLILLDVNLPDGTGITLLKELKQRITCPVLFLTARDMEMDIVLGLESGADDYITKPFSLAVLRARVRARLRPTVETRYMQDGFVFDFDNMEFTKNGCSLTFSKTEQKLLKILVANHGQILPRATLVERVWPQGFVDENALSVTVKRLRNKLEDNPAKPVYLQTIYGIGYQWMVK